MIKKLSFAAIMLNSSLVYAEELKQPMKDQSFYLKLGTGASFARKADVHASPAVWDPAVEGYNAGLGTRPILLAGVGYDSPYASTEITGSYRPNFKYAKFQTPSTSGIVGQLATKTRRFNLDVTSWMWNLFLNGRGCRRLNWMVTGNSSIFPYVGAGVGASQLKIFNFRSTGLAPIDPPLPSFGSENELTVRYKFTYQVMGGLEYRYRDTCALALGYRWLSAGRFNGPIYIRDPSGNALEVRPPWKIGFSANEATLEFKIFL